MVEYGDKVGVVILHEVENYSQPQNDHFVYIGRCQNNKVSVVSPQPVKGKITCIVKRPAEKGNIMQVRPQTQREVELETHWKNEKKAHSFNHQHKLANLDAGQKVTVIPRGTHWGNKMKWGYGGYLQDKRFKFEPTFNTFFQAYWTEGTPVPCQLSYIHTTMYTNERIAFLKLTDDFLKEKLDHDFNIHCQGIESQVRLSVQSLEEFELTKARSALRGLPSSATYKGILKEYKDRCNGLEDTMEKVLYSVEGSEIITEIETHFFWDYISENPDLKEEVMALDPGSDWSSLSLFDKRILRLLHETVPEESKEYLQMSLDFAWTFNRHPSLRRENLYHQLIETFEGSDLDLLAVARDEAFSAYAKIDSDLFVPELIGGHYLENAVEFWKS